MADGFSARRGAALAVVVGPLVTGGAAAALLTPAPGALPHSPADLAGWLGRSDPDVTLGALAWAGVLLCVAWWAVAALASLAAAVPGGRRGWRSSPLAGRLAPAVLRRAVEVAAGSAVTTSLLAGPAVATPSSPSLATPGAVAVCPAPSLDWPGTATACSPLVRATAETGHGGAAHPRPHPRAHPPAAERVVVRRGDSLWSLAAARLPHPSPARVAACWPRWYAANRAVVGPDPDLLQPGAVLRPPAGGST